MKQSKFLSFIESAANTLVGVLVAWCVAMVIFPLYGYKITPSSAFTMNIWFTAASFIRSYIIRRYFNGLRFS